jgi:pimeloyl-ACP methyl ester carboxylesterase
MHPRGTVKRLCLGLLAIQLLAAIAIAVPASLHINTPGFAFLFGIAVVLLVRLLITVNNFALSRRYRSLPPPDSKLNGWQAIRLVFREYRATMATSSWNMPFRTFGVRLVPQAASLPVLLIHGYVCNSGYWQPMSRRLAQAGVSHCALDLEPVFGDIDDYVPQIHAAVENLAARTGSRRVLILAHSMGGLAARAYLRRHGTHRIAAAITLGTPHHGTALARFGLGLNTSQMHWSVSAEQGLASLWLQTLNREESETTRGLFVSIYSRHDNIVAPQESSRLPGARNIAFAGIGHVDLAFHPAIQEEALRQIMLASAEASAMTQGF